jgi:uncharacterized protein (TIGR03086 family)
MISNMTSLQMEIDRHRRALDEALPIVSAIDLEDLDRSTPCAGWTLRDLLAHLIGQQQGFTLAVRDGDAPPAAYRPPTTPDDEVLARWRSTADGLQAALRAAPEGATAHLAELTGVAGPLPMTSVAAVQTLDTLVHTWDVARSLDREYRPAEDLVTWASAFARRIPDDETRHRPDAAFAPALPSDPDDAWSLALALLGRK